MVTLCYGKNSGASTSENVPSDICAQRRFRSARHSRSLIRIFTGRILWNSQICNVSSCACWSGSSLGAHVRRYVFSCWSLVYSYINLFCVSFTNVHQTIFDHYQGKITFSSCADSGGPDQTARMRSLIRAFAIREQNDWIRRHVFAGHDT